MSVRGFARFAFALAMIGLGVITLASDDFALPWQPIPAWLPWYSGVAYASGFLLLAGGIGLLFQRAAAVCALGLAVYLLVGWVLPQALKLAPSISSIGAWLGFCETLAVLSGALMLWAKLSEQTLFAGSMQPLSIRRNIVVARILFGACCVVFGLSHFAYADFTAGMIPAWMPERLWLAYITGAGHIAAGLAIVFTLLPRLGAALEALMMSAFVCLVHIPSIGASPPLAWAPTDRIQWTALFWALALASAAWVMAESFRDRGWVSAEARS